MEDNMKKSVLSILIFFLCLPIFSARAFASAEDTVRVGLYYSGSSSYGALLSANLENYQDTGSGYYFGYYDAERVFVPLGETDVRTISMSQDANLYVGSDGSYSTTATSGVPVIGCYHLQMKDAFASYDAANDAAQALKERYGTAFPAYENGAYVVRVGAYSTRADAEALLLSGNLDAAVNSGTGYTVTVTKTGTNEILFEYDDGGKTCLAVEPRPTGTEQPQTWFKGYRYYGGFEYDRDIDLSGGKINVVNVVGLEDYVKCVITWEMSASWPEEALKAQSVCARTYALNQHKHDVKNFDVCATTDCQVYRGAASVKDASNAAVDATAGEMMYYHGQLIDAPYYSSNGGASEDAENVWYTPLGYLRGKADPYESTITIPGYAYEKTYTAEELTALLQKKGKDIGTVVSVTCTYTENGNMYEMTFADAAGKTATYQKENCKFLLSASSMRFTVTGSGGTSGVESAAGSASLLEYFINGISAKIQSLFGVYTISGSGIVTKYESESAYVITANGKERLGEAGGTQETPAADVAGKTTVSTGDVFTVQGTGSGHNVGMSQYGAYAMAKLGMDYTDILHFYYTDIEIK